MEDPLPFQIDYFSDPKMNLFVPLDKITFDNRYFIDTTKYPTMKDAMDHWVQCDPILSRMPPEFQLSIIREIYCPNGTPKIGDKRKNKIQTAQIDKQMKENQKHFERMLNRQKRILKKTAKPTMVYFE